MNYKFQIRPEWVAKDTTRVGAFDVKNLSDLRLKDTPSTSGVLQGKEKLSSYFTFPHDREGTKYYVTHYMWHAEDLEDVQDEKVMYIDEHGKLWDHMYGTTRWHNLFPDHPMPLILTGMYAMRRDGKGGFVMCGDVDQTSMPRDLMDGTAGFKLKGTKARAVPCEREVWDRLERAMEDDTTAGKLRNQHELGTLSYKCLSRFLVSSKLASIENIDTQLDKYMQPLFEAIDNGSLEVVDAEPSDTKRIMISDPAVMKPLGDKVKCWGAEDLFFSGNETLHKHKPGPGYVATGVDVPRDITTHPDVGDLDYTKGYIRYHRSGNVLMEYAKGGIRKHYVFGVDEEQYFGCELPKTAKNTTEALLTLAPSQAVDKKKKKLKKGVLRQGEWFLIPRTGKEAVHPYMNNCAQITEFLWVEENITLPIDSPDANLHTFATSEFGELRALYADAGVDLPIGCAYVHLPTGRIFVQSGYLTHSQGTHADVRVHERSAHVIDKWCDSWELVRNTAVQSFSEDGVD